MCYHDKCQDFLWNDFITGGLIKWGKDLRDYLENIGISFLKTSKK